MNWEIIVSDGHLTVSFPAEFTDIDGVVFRPGDVMGERCCQEVPIQMLGVAPAALLTEWRRLRPNTRVQVASRKVLRFCYRSAEAAEQDIVLLESLLLKHVGRGILAATA